MATPVLVQFVVERQCPGVPLRLIPDLPPDLLPYPVWVEFPALGPCRCCGKPAYVVTDDSRREARAAAGLPDDERRVACESMGQVIE